MYMYHLQKGEILKGECSIKYRVEKMTEAWRTTTHSTDYQILFDLMNVPSQSEPFIKFLIIWFNQFTSKLIIITKTLPDTNFGEKIFISICLFD